MSSTLLYCYIGYIYIYIDVAQWQNTGNHNQLSWVEFPAIAAFVFSLLPGT